MEPFVPMLQCCVVGDIFLRSTGFDRALSRYTGDWSVTAILLPDLEFSVIHQLHSEKIDILSGQMSMYSLIGRSP